MTGVSTGDVSAPVLAQGAVPPETASKSPLICLPDEDAGAQTQGRFTWQHHCIAAECITKMSETPSVQIVCEMHEDYLVVLGDRVDLVSCKHRETSRGPWSLQELCSTGGLAHLYSRWSSFSGCTARLLTNAGLKSGAGEAREVLNELTRQDRNRELALLSLARALMLANPKGLHGGIPVVTGVKGKARATLNVPSEFLSSVAQFANALQVVDSLPAREHIRSIHIQEIALPYLAKESPGALGAEEGYDRLVYLIAGKNSIDPLKANYVEWFSGKVQGSAGAMVRARSLSHSDIKTCFSPVSLRFPLESYPEADHSRLRVKLLQGGLKTTRVNSAAKLREAWLAAWAKQRLDLPGDEVARHDLETRLLQLAGDMEADCCVDAPDGVWGDRMYQGLWVRIEERRDQLRGALPLSTEHLVGLAMDMTEQCHIWFSDSFDVDGVLRDLETGS